MQACAPRYALTYATTLKLHLVGCTVVALHPPSLCVSHFHVGQDSCLPTATLYRLGLLSQSHKVTVCLIENTVSNSSSIVACLSAA
jgi:hypothetical protein